MNTDLQKPTKSVNVRLRIWNWIFVCSQAVLITLLVITYIQESRGYKHIDTFYHPIAGATVIALLLVTPLFLVIATPFFWGRLLSAETGLCVGVIGLAFIVAPVF